MNGKVIRDWILILIILAVAIYLILFLNSNSSQCLKQPIVYQLNTIEKSNPGTTATCSCYSYKAREGGIMMDYNSTGEFAYALKIAQPWANMSFYGGH